MRAKQRLARLLGGLLLLCTQCRAAPEAESPLVQVRLARLTPASGFVLTKASANDTSFYVAETVIVSDNDVEEASARRTEDGLVVVLTITPAARFRMAHVTEAHVGERLGVFLDGRLASTPVIMQALKAPPGGKVVMGFRLSPPDADRIAAAVSAHWPPAH